MRDRDRPEVRLGRELQLNIIELRKADRLGQLPERLSAWIAYFEHWREESTMSNPYPPVQRAFEKLRELSADEEARYWAEARAKALSDEASLLSDAREEGRVRKRQEAGSGLEIQQDKNGAVRADVRPYRSVDRLDAVLVSPNQSVTRAQCDDLGQGRERGQVSHCTVPLTGAAA